MDHLKRATHILSSRSTNYHHKNIISEHVSISIDFVYFSVNLITLSQVTVMRVLGKLIHIFSKLN